MMVDDAPCAKVLAAVESLVCLLQSHLLVSSSMYARSALQGVVRTSIMRPDASLNKCAPIMCQPILINVASRAGMVPVTMAHGCFTTFILCW